MLDPQFHAQLIHDIKFVIEASLAACFVVFWYLVIPYTRNK